MDTIADFADLHAGKRLFILASGPSLADCDLDRLERRLTMGLNRSFLAWPDTHYHCVMDHRLFDLYPDQLRRTRYLFTLEGRPWGIPLRLLGSQGWSDDPRQGVYSGYTIAYLALQIAIFMGFAEIYLLGLDLCHRDGDTHFFGFDHCSANHETSEFPKMIAAFESVAERIAQLPVSIYNCSPISTLRCFPRRSFNEAVVR